MASSVAAVGCDGSSGMSATKSPTARRSAGEPYGAASASRTARGSAGRDRAVVARTKVGVATQTAWRTPSVRAIRMSDGAAAFEGWWTAVLVSTTAASCSRCASAQPKDTGPPQSWARVTTGPVMPSASVRLPRSSTRSASVRGPVRSE